MAFPSQRLALLESVVEQSFDAVLITDADFTSGGPFIVYVNPQFCAMTGYSTDELIGRSPQMFQGAETNPDVIAHLRQCVRNGLFFEGSTINYRADGSTYIVEWRISPVRDERGTIRHFVSVQRNISRQIQVEQDKHLLGQALNAALEAIFVTDRDANVVFANEAFQKLTGYCAIEIIGQTPRILSSGKHDELFYARLSETLDSGKSARMQFLNKRKDGTVFHAEYSISPLLSPEGEVTHYVSIVQDVTERLGREQKLIKIARSDPLTGLYNRRAAEHALERQINMAQVSGKSFSLIIGDIDHFKSINDQYGHPAGDDVLKNVANILIHRIRKRDIAVRWGGEEFVVLAPDSSLQQASELAERIRKGVESLALEGIDSVTISLGVAELANGETSASLIQRADSALYQAKRSGRNRIAHAKP
ncbi:diguanylate cyclase [Pseudomonas sp. Pseusp122]|uniref:diguanylate cyclase n=1 Tax=unclassified Pseudomonas TaxID=196821 RepID=UPI0039A62991